MLSFKLRNGDDVWFGRRGTPLERYKQVIVSKSDGRYLTVLTPTETIDIPFGDQRVDLGLFGVKVSALPDDTLDDQYLFGMEAPDCVHIVRGRVYRRSLDA